MADLGCAAGTDTIALARAGARVVAVDRDPVARELTRLNAATLGLTGVEVRDADVVDLVAAAADGRVAGCDAAVLDPARRAGGRRLLDPDRWSPPWSTVTALLDRVPTAVVKVAPGLDHDRVPGRRRGRVGLGRRLDRRGAAVGARAVGHLAPGDPRARRRPRAHGGRGPRARRRPAPCAAGCTSPIPPSSAPA